MKKTRPSKPIRDCNYDLTCLSTRRREDDVSPGTEAITLAGPRNASLRAALSRITAGSVSRERARWKQGETEREDNGEIAFLIGLLAGLSSAKLLKGR